MEALVLAQLETRQHLQPITQGDSGRAEAFSPWLRAHPRLEPIRLGGDFCDSTAAGRADRPRCRLSTVETPPALPDRGHRDDRPVQANSSHGAIELGRTEREDPAV